MLNFGHFGVWIMVGLMFIFVAAILYIAIQVIPLLAVSAKKATAMVEDAHRISHPQSWSTLSTDNAWILAYELIREALIIDPSNTYAAGALYGLAFGMLPPSKRAWDGRQDVGGVSQGVIWAQPPAENDVFLDLPKNYMDLMSEVWAEFEWLYIPPDGYPREYRPPTDMFPIRPKLRARRVRRFFAQVGHLHPDWIAGIIGVGFLAPIVLVWTNEAYGSTFFQSYADICNYLVWDCYVLTY